VLPESISLTLEIYGVSGNLHTKVCGKFRHQSPIEQAAGRPIVDEFKAGLRSKYGTTPLRFPFKFLDKPSHPHS
jgi:hypothetical protein